MPRACPRDAMFTLDYMLITPRRARALPQNMLPR